MDNNGNEEDVDSRLYFDCADKKETQMTFKGLVQSSTGTVRVSVCIHLIAAVQVVAGVAEIKVDVRAAMGFITSMFTV